MDLIYWQAPYSKELVRVSQMRKKNVQKDKEKYYKSFLYIYIFQNFIFFYNSFSICTIKKNRKEKKRQHLINIT